MNLTELRPNQRYLFHYKNSHQQDDPLFRANFVKLLINGKYSYLIVNGYHSKRYQNEKTRTVWSIDTNLISKVDSLSDIIGENCVLPDDVLIEIDNYT
jgi:hypothetical protein